MSRWTFDNQEPVWAVPDLGSGARDPARDPESLAQGRDQQSSPCAAREDVGLGRREPTNRDFKQWGLTGSLPTAWGPYT